MEEKRNNNIELRSEKVRNLVGQIPPVLLQYGVMIILFVIFLLVSIIGFFLTNI
ncbi:MAG: hypothetical protein LUG51_13070 [Tannerellaceae bacterium]|nr:hypothetical protein [Tannerellaceae bacterium]